MKRFPRILFSTLLLGVLATPLVFEGIAAASINTPTQTIYPVLAGSSTTYSKITVNSASWRDYVALAASGLPTGAIASDAGDGCVAVPFGSGTVNFTNFSVIAGSVSGTFTITATQYSNSSCSKNPTTLATATPTLTVKTPLAITDPTQTTNPVAAGSSTTYSTITVSNGSNGDHVALAASGLPTDAVASDTGDGCVAVSGGNATFSHFSVVAGAGGGTFTLTATEYSNSTCTSSAVTAATSTPTLAVAAPAVSDPTQTTNPVVAGSPTTYTPITFSGGFNGYYVAVAASGLPTGAVASDTGDGCVAVSATAATFSHFSVVAGAVGGSFTLTATEYSNSACLTAVATATASPTLTVTPFGPAAQLTFSTQPTAGQNIQANGTGTFTASVAVEDANGNHETGTNTGTVTLSIGTNSAAGVLSCISGLTATVASGTASFTGCAITKVGAGYKLTASSSPSYSAPTNATSFDITAGSATTISLSQGYNESTTVGGPFASAVIARVTDANGNVVSGATVTFTAPGSGASGTFKATGGTCLAGGTETTSCSVVTGSTGVASALTFTASATAGAYVVAVSSPGTTPSPLENPMTNLVGAPAIFTFVVQPTVGQNVQATGTGSFDATVAVEDAGGNVETNANTGTVTLGIGINPSSGVLRCSGGLTSNVVAGEASFTGCSITSAGVGYTLSASSSPSYTAPTNANAFNITAGSASQLAFVAQPSDAFVGAAMAPVVTVQIEDQNGNASSSSSTVGVTPSASALSSGSSVAAVGGVATFSGITFSLSGLGLSLTATSPGLTSATSSTFSVSVLMTKSSDQLSDGATDSGGSGMKSVNYYYCMGFSNTPTACDSSNGTEIGSPATTSPFTVAWSSLPSSGAYRVVAVGTDNAGNITTSDTTPVSVDASGPVGGAISVPDYATTLSVNIASSSYTDSLVGMASNVITRSGGLSPTSGICPTSGYTGSTVVTSPDTGVVSGKCYEYTLSGTSNVGQVATVTSGPVLVDTSAPVTTITLTPASPNGTNGWYDGTNPTFTLSTSDGGAGVQTTYYEIDGGTATVYPGSAVTIPNGAAQTVTYWSVDIVGNLESAHTTAALSIDTEGPSGSITAPTANVTVSGSSVTVTSNSADGLSGIASVAFQYATHGESTWTTIGTDTASPYSVTWNASTLSGQYDLRTVTMDNAGNSSTSTIVTVTVTATTSGSYSGASNGNMSNGTAYYSINATSTGSTTKTANSITPNTAETLTGLTFNLLSTSGSAHSVTIDLIANNVATATALTCTIPAGSRKCTATGNVTIPVGDSINVAGVGNGNHAGTWTTTYTRP
jgi:hypothetical protein